MVAPKRSPLLPPPARVAVEAARVGTRDPGGSARTASIPAPVRAPLGLVTREAAPWVTVLPRLGMAMAIFPLLFLVLWFLGVGDHAADHALGDDYVELLAAGRAAVVFQTAVLVEGIGWLVVAAFLVSAARISQETSRVRSTFSFGLGVASMLGLVAALVRLSGTARLGLDYTVADGSERVVLAAGYLGVVQVQSALFHAAYITQGLGFILAGSALWSVRAIPPGLGGWITVPGFTALISWSVAVAANNRPDLAILVVPMLVVHSVALAAVGLTTYARMRSMART